MGPLEERRPEGEGLADAFEARDAGKGKTGKGKGAKGAKGKTAAKGDDGDDKEEDSAASDSLADVLEACLLYTSPSPRDRG